MAEPSNRGITFPEQQKREVGNVVETVKDKAHDLAGTVKDKAQELAGSAQQAWDSGKHQAQQAWDSGKHQAQQYAAQVGDKVENAFDDVQSFVRRYPIACVMGGFFVGALFAGACNLSSSRR